MSNFIKTLGNQVGKLLRDVVEVPNIIVNSVDEALHDFADKKIDTIIDYRKSVAMQNPVYAEIEARRKTDNGNIICLSDEDNLTMEHWDIQNNIYDTATDEPFLMPFYRFLNNAPLHTFIYKIKHAGQRLSRGWDDTATWSLDYHLTLTLGNQLKHLAKTTHGWPQSDKFPKFEDWQKALENNGNILLTYANREELLFGENVEYDKALEEQIIKDAQKALRWVATYLPNLWD